LRSDLLKALTPLAAREVEDRASALPLPPLLAEYRDNSNAHTLNNAADIRDLMLRVSTRWKVPHVDVCIRAFSEVERQRTQSRINHLAEAGEYNSFGAIAAVVTVILGTIRVTLLFLDRTMEERFIDAYVTSTRMWEYAVGLVIAAASAWLIGKILGVLWCRLRLLVFLLRVWLRARRHAI